MDVKSQESELIWKNLSLATRNGDGSRKVLLKGISGSIGPSSMTSLMGTSGAGKTTLLNSLAGRLPSNMELRGNILLNGHQRSKDTWSELIGYVEQEFHAYEYQTVHETLLFASKIKMEDDSSSQEVLDRIDEVLGLLGLKNAKHTYVARLSGGERKRVSIGVELLGNPPVLFCDEPTSGLDSFNALNILSLLKDLSKMGKTILVTIHQPSYEMIEFFDKMILMSMGQIVYDGEVKGCIKFFDRCGHPLPELTNPADFFLNTISLDSRTQSGEERSLNTINHIRDKWYREKEEPTPRLSKEVEPRVHRTASSLSFLLLWSRNMLNYGRNVGYLKVKIFQKIFFLLVFGLAYLQIGYSVESIYTRLGGITFILTNSLFGVCSPIFNVFPIEKKIIFRERRSGMYSGVVAFLAKYCSEILINMIFEIPYLVAIYWIIGLNPNVGRFVVFIIIVMSLTFFSIGYALAISTLFSSENTSQVVGTMGLLVFLIYSGSFNNPQSIPGWLRWLVWISPVYYATKAAFQNQLSDVVFNGSGQGDQSAQMQQTQLGGGQVITGEEEIAMRGLQGTGVWPCILILWGQTLVWIAFGAVMLHYNTRNRIKMTTDEKQEV